MRYFKRQSGRGCLRSKFVVRQRGDNFCPETHSFAGRSWKNVQPGGSAARIWGEFFILAWRILGKLPANFSANFDGKKFSRQICFSQGFRPPHKNFTPKKSSAFLLNFTFLKLTFCHADFFCLQGRPKIFVTMSFSESLGRMACADDI